MKVTLYAFCFNIARSLKITVAGTVFTFYMLLDYSSILITLFLRYQSVNQSYKRFGVCVGTSTITVWLPATTWLSAMSRAEELTLTLGTISQLRGMVDSTRMAVEVRSEGEMVQHIAELMGYDQHTNPITLN